MDARSYTAEERRAANQVWAAAGAYGFEPLFLARNTDGTIDFYMNCVVGLVHKYYGDDLLRDLFATWDGDLRESQLDDLTWLYLESAVYLLELPRRPVLSELRRAHADYFFGIQYKLSRQEWMAKNQLVYTMQADRWRTVQGRHPPVPVSLFHFGKFIHFSCSRIISFTAVAWFITCLCIAAVSMVLSFAVSPSTIWLCSRIRIGKFFSSFKYSTR